jgi:large subunit ribosomal protein L10
VRPEKQYAVQEIKDRLGQGDTFVLTRFAGLTAEKLNEFRGALHEQSASYMVVKNRLLKIAAKEAGFEQLSDFIDGPVGIIFGSEEYSGYLKEVVKFNKDNQLPEILGGYIEQQYFPAENVKILASLPSKEVLQSQLLGAMQAPISQFVSVLAQRLASFVRVIDAISKKKAEEGGPVAEEAEVKVEEPKAEESVEAAAQAPAAEAEKAESVEEKSAGEKPVEAVEVKAVEEKPAEEAEKAEAAEEKPVEEAPVEAAKKKAVKEKPVEKAPVEAVEVKAVEEKPAAEAEKAEAAEEKSAGEKPVEAAEEKAAEEKPAEEAEEDKGQS